MVLLKCYAHKKKYNKICYISMLASKIGTITNLVRAYILQLVSVLPDHVNFEFLFVKSYSYSPAGDLENYTCWLHLSDF